MTSTELRQRAADLEAKAKALLESVSAENRDLSEDEQSSYDGWLEEADKLEARATKLDEINARVEARNGSPGRVSTPIAGRVTPGEQEADRRHSFGDFLRNVGIVGDSKANRYEHETALNTLTNQYRAHYSSWTDDKRPAHVRAMAAQSGVAGGYTVPTAFQTKIMEVAAPLSIVRPRAFIVPMETLEIDVPMLDQTTAQSAGTPPYFGGMTAAWTGDGTTINDTEAKFRAAKMANHELTGYTEIPRSLIATSVTSLEALVYRMYGGAVAWYEDYAFLRGNGIGKPLGVLNAPCRVQTAARGSASAITFANARSVWVRVLAESRANGVWLGSQLAESAILDMTGTANSVFVPSGYTISNGNAAGQAINYAILARPVLISAKLPNLNVDGDFGFFDFSQYMIGDFGAMEVAASEHFKFKNNMMAYRFVHRVGGMPWMNNALTLEDGSTTVSPDRKSVV